MFGHAWRQWKLWVWCHTIGCWSRWLTCSHRKENLETFVNCQESPVGECGRRLSTNRIFRAILALQLTFFVCICQAKRPIWLCSIFLYIIHKKIKKPKPWNWTNFRRYWAGQKKYSSIWFPRFFRLVDSPNCGHLFLTPLSFSTNIINFYSYMLYIAMRKA